ncbi:Ras guanine nucleotide exchange factor [Heterostelium album PN500]|uniref:Ras guanine nucleotide exchange factor n=1 Tax=Heterostelium pallidum (strain ATCC 26659 / Pp 5 / PN500) TaxID=670386 RepID=D3B6I0_HETP5|nr:Ras guanine nucleotide exchange factor [Heterostelium album PN500]EFA82950.1 Ras guanine nucleotide exchange factor [Heterostelium album PN500]|eukprot:XP_020435067.1 Ras guanine nucleotide exchange factor [Heterostelium album PN500]
MVVQTKILFWENVLSLQKSHLILKRHINKNILLYNSNNNNKKQVIKYLILIFALANHIQSSQKKPPLHQAVTTIHSHKDQNIRKLAPQTNKQFNQSFKQTKQNNSIIDWNDIITFSTTNHKSIKKYLNFSLSHHYRPPPTPTLHPPSYTYRHNKPPSKKRVTVAATTLKVNRTDNDITYHVSEVSLIGITAVLFQRDQFQRWQSIDDSLCRLEILQNEKEVKFRLVAISNDNRWVRTNSSITKCSDLFLEIKQTSSQTSKTDSIGVNFAYKEEVSKFFDCYNSCIKALQNSKSTLPNSVSIPDDLSMVSISISSSSPPLNSELPQSANTSVNISNYLDLPLPPPPPTAPPSPIVSDQSSIGGVTYSGAGLETLPPPPPTSLGSTPPMPISGSKSGSFSFPSSSTPPTLPLQDLFNPPKALTTITTTTTTTITRNNANSDTTSVLKTASGRRSIRARSSTTDQKRTLTRKDGYAISLQNVEGLQNIGEALEEETLNLLDLVNEQVVHPTTNVLLINQSINKIYEHLQILFILTAESASSHHGSKLVTTTTERIQRGWPTMPEISGIIGQNWYNLDDVNSAGTGFTNLLYLKKNLVPTIAYLSTSVRVLGLQASLEAEWMARNRASDPENIVVQLAILGNELITAMARLYMATQSFCSVCNSIQNLSKEQNGNLLSVGTINRDRSPSTADLINLWEELKIIKDLPQLPKEGSSLKASLNQLVILLTSELNYDTKFLKTFITTYQSFAQPRLLFTKLLERYAVPEWFSTNQSKISMIRQRVIVVLKYWIVNQSSDFDQDLMDQIYHFIDNTLINDGYAELSKALGEILGKMVEEREVKLELLFQMPPRIQFTEECTLSPIELFFEWSPLAIAQQLTLIDFSIFRDIEAREFLNQNFNKPKMKYRAPNIMRLINRSTQFSFWIAKLILIEGKKEKRLKVLEKLLDVAKILLKINNFNTLMSLVAGLNMTPVHRLKKTKKKLSSSASSTLAECERIFSSKKSFKNYRDIITNTVPPCIPYLGINLTDFTFIEEGNQHVFQDPNSPSPLINFKKRELFYQAWSDISRFQETPYSFQAEEPINTLLLHFPIVDEDRLYELSTSVEPK